MQPINLVEVMGTQCLTKAFLQKYGQKQIIFDHVLLGMFFMALTSCIPSSLM